MSNMELLGAYKNGNYYVSIYDDGTKIRENNLDFFEAEFPESFDLKITNKCHNTCPVCHENSSCTGKHGDIMSHSFIDTLHPYTEIAIGGGNPLEHPDLVPFLKKLKKLKMIPSMTIRQNDFMDNIELLHSLCEEKLIYGLGVSLVNPKQDNFIEALKDFPNAVIHVIAGIITLEELAALANNNLKVLILGYKTVRRGEDFYSGHSEEITAKIDALKNQLKAIVDDRWFSVVSFDNLAIKQLDSKRLMSNELWSKIYMGDDGIDGQTTSASMFIDMVERQFAKNSCDMVRYPLANNIVSMFNQIRGI